VRSLPQASVFHLSSDRFATQVSGCCIDRLRPPHVAYAPPSMAASPPERHAGPARLPGSIRAELPMRERPGCRVQTRPVALLPHPRKTTAVRIAVLIPATLMLPACAANPGRQATAPALAARPDAEGAQVEAGQALDAVLRLGAAGSIDPAALAGATGRYRDAAARCLATPGCDAARVAEGALSLVGADPTLHTVGEDVPAVADEGESSPVTTHLPEAARSVNLLNGRELSDVIALNGPVKAAMTEWLTWMRPQLIDAWEHYQAMRHLMWPEYCKAGLH